MDESSRRRTAARSTRDARRSSNQSFGQIHTRQGKRVLLRGLDQAQDEWNLIAGCHNLMKLFIMQSKALLAAPAGT